MSTLIDRVDACEVILLDAMGVIYVHGDDVSELLIPFVHEMGARATAAEIRQAYRRASLGELRAEEFWAAVGLSSGVEDAYLSRHVLASGLIDFLDRKSVV